ncbi:putative RNA 2'-phosphotransferase [Nonlabens dokdonensis]|uniref:Probable RNA 2'-phosphotransferase n=2 Tax=Nonlabens dokdonensis TaxID=328515 RepID=L7WA79_NONDD|nr:RNA 2'-phosphotransferase [Nonlabens dokdonensis]AGC75778.1 RNA 2'-phosphotransferase [Nonlabens dokdonensis DSW-6]PZX43460.1 putative RNA 2'-phosphotransferase [Nonlabens dokdonensis]
MNKNNISRFLSLVLRHDPSKIGITLDNQGWIAVDTLLTQLKEHDKEISFDTLKNVVETNDKQRFAFNEDQTKIRANQGHSITVDLKYRPLEPPELLYHGTVAKFVDGIKEKGLLKMNRHHVHLSESLETAIKVGARRGKPIILTVQATAMYKAGYQFYKSENQVWLTDVVPTNYIEFKR